MATYAAKLDRVSNRNFVDTAIRSGLTSADIAASVIGTVFYVDSVNGTVSNDGLTWATAVTTVDLAVAKCTADSGDLILMAPWHVETEAGVDTAVWTMGVDGVSLVGIKQGYQMPTFTFTDDGALASVTGANCVVQNCKFVSGVIDLASALTLGAASDGTVIDGCEFRDGDSAVLEIVYGISITALASDITIQNCTFITFAAGSGTESAILGIGAHDRLRVLNNVFSGDWNDSVMDLSTTASTNILVADNVAYSLDAADGHVVKCNASSTGNIVRNLMFAGENTQAAVVAAGCHASENYQTTVEAESGNLVPAAGDWAA